MSDRLPDLLITGAPKAGTTTLAGWLAGHPDVAMSGTKELEFFDLHHDRGLGWYRGQLPDAPEDMLIGEATPGYLAHPLAAERVAAAVPDVRCVVVLREPARRAWSHYWFLRWLGVEHLSWRRAIAAELRGRPRFGYLDAGRYATHLARWDVALSPGQQHVMLFDDLVSEPLKSFASVCRYLGISDEHAPSTTESVNPTRLPRNYPLQVLLHKTGLSRRRFGRDLHVWNLWGGTPPSMPADEAARLRAHFASENARLEDRLQRALPASWA